MHQLEEYLAWKCDPKHHNRHRDSGATHGGGMEAGTNN